MTVLRLRLRAIEVPLKRSVFCTLEVRWADLCFLSQKILMGLKKSSKSVLKKALFGQNGSQNGPIRGRKRPTPGYFCQNVTPIPSRRDGRRFGADPVTIPENHIFARVASGGLLLSKSGAERGGGGETGLRRESKRIELFLCIMFHFKTARVCPLGQFPDP